MIFKGVQKLNNEKNELIIKNQKIKMKLNHNKGTSQNDAEEFQLYTLREKTNVAVKNFKTTTINT